MKIKMGVLSATLALIMAGAGCGGMSTGSSGSDPSRITAEQMATLDVSTLYEVVQRMRPRWLQVRSPRGLQTQTQIAVFLDRTYLGGPDELRSLGVDVAEWLQYRSGSDVQGELTVPGSFHVEGAIIVHTGSRGAR
jgi:hypothetical protein